MDTISSFVLLCIHGCADYDRTGLSPFRWTACGLLWTVKTIASGVHVNYFYWTSLLPQPVGSGSFLVDQTAVVRSCLLSCFGTTEGWVWPSEALVESRATTNTALRSTATYVVLAKFCCCSCTALRQTPVRHVRSPMPWHTLLFGHRTDLTTVDCIAAHRNNQLC